MAKGSFLVAAALACAPAAAMAQWSDNFDSYSVGTIQGQGGWAGWDNTPSAAGEVTNNFFRSGPNSQMIQGGADSVHQYSGATSGQWSYTAQQFIPSGLTTGATYFILLNDYNEGAAGDKDWSSELFFDLAGNVVFDDLDNVGSPSPGSNSVPLVRDAWVPIRVDVDLDANTFSSYYNDALVYSGEWTRGVGFQAIEAVDLFANNAGSVYYDDMALTMIPAPGVGAVLALAGLGAARRRRR